MAGSLRLQKTGQGGFTLLELLISLVIVGMVLTLAMASYAYFISEWERTESRPATTFTQVRNLELVNRAVESAYDYYVQASPTPYRQIYVPFFSGSETSFRFVTASPVFAPGQLALAELSSVAITGENESEEYDLVYREWPMTRELLREWGGQPETEPKHLALLQQLNEIAIEYYGFADKASRARANYRFETTAPAETGRWFEEYQSQATELMPEAIRITLRPAEETAEPFSFFFRLPEGEPSKSLFLNQEF